MAEKNHQRRTLADPIPSTSRLHEEILVRIEKPHIEQFIHCENKFTLLIGIFAILRIRFGKLNIARKKN